MQSYPWLSYRYWGLSKAEIAVAIFFSSWTPSWCALLGQLDICWCCDSKKADYWEKDVMWQRLMKHSLFCCWQCWPPPLGFSTTIERQWFHSFNEMPWEWLKYCSLRLWQRWRSLTRHLWSTFSFFSWLHYFPYLNGVALFVAALRRQSVVLSWIYVAKV